MLKTRISTIVPMLLILMLLAAAGCTTATQAPEVPAATEAAAEPAATEAPAAAETKPLRVALYAQYIQWFPLEEALKEYQATHPDFQYEFLTLPAEEQAYAALTQKLQLDAQL